jgi:hypothetical protein
MSLSDYAGLQAAIAATVDRTDVAGAIPGWIAMAEAAMNRTVRHWRMEARAIGDVSARFFALPEDWRETVRLHDPATANRLELVSHAEIQRQRMASLRGGAPRLYAMTAGELEFYPVPDAGYEVELVYYAAIPPLSVAEPVNWALRDYPDAYLYGALVHSAPYLQEDARLQTWGALFAAAVEGMNAESRAARASGTGLRRRNPIG